MVKSKEWLKYYGISRNHQKAYVEQTIKMLFTTEFYKTLKWHQRLRMRLYIMLPDWFTYRR